MSSKKLIITLSLIIPLALFFFAWLWWRGLVPVGGDFREKFVNDICQKTGGILYNTCGFSQCHTRCLGPHLDANKLCTESKQCRAGCFVDDIDGSLLSKCKGVDYSVVYDDYKIVIKYECPDDIKIEGVCAPIDLTTGQCSQSTFFDGIRYQLFEGNKIAPVGPAGVYACPTS